MNLNETLTRIIDDETKNIIDDCAIKRIVKRILKFKDEWNMVVEEHIYEFHIPHEELYSGGDSYSFTKWINIEMKKKIKKVM